MSVFFGASGRRLAAGLVIAAIALLAAGQVGAAALPPAEAARLLRGVYERSKPAEPGRARRIEIASSETSGSVEGSVWGVIPEAYPAVRGLLADPARWCGILMLHINNKSCRTESRRDETSLTLRIASRYDQAADKASAVTFSLRTDESTSDYLAVNLGAADGPLWTRDHRIVLEAIPLDGGRTFLRLGYSYGYGLPAEMAMDVYFATSGSGKVGFTETRAGSGGGEHIGGVRGLMERNAMRYFLAVDAYLGELAAPQAERQERRLRRWYDSTELYPRQLHEIDRETYLRLKRRELAATEPAR
ncbi:MAG: hypothetical protein ABI641_00450 [Caldimonas sp.]